MAEEVILVKAENTIALKRALAKNLYLKKKDQVQISSILNISQPMVSNYLSSKEEISNEIINLAERISEKICNGNSANFHTCVTFLDDEIQGNFYVANETELISEEKTKIIDNLIEAFFLLKDKNIVGLIPEVKINIAMAKENAKNPDDVAAFLNGLIIADDKVTGNNGIRFGKSRHLTNLVLYLRNKIKVNAMMNLAYHKDIKKTTFKLGYLTKDFKFENKQITPDILIHKGDFGIEPCVYVLGGNAVEVVNKVLRLKEELNGIER
jgi:hypothetical protein